jgi:small-conductance mechanosensitive channel
MPKMIACVQVLMVLACLAGPAPAQDNQALLPRAPELQGLTPNDARRLLVILTDESRRAQLMESLREIAGVPTIPGQPAAGPPSKPGDESGADQRSGQPSTRGLPSGQGEPGSSQPPDAPQQSAPSQARPVTASQPEQSSGPGPSQAASPQAAPGPRPGQSATTPGLPAKPGERPDTPVGLEPGSLGAQLLSEFAGWLRDAGRTVDQTIEAATHHWQSRQVLLDALERRETLDRLGDIAWRVVVVIALSLAVEWLALLILRRPRAALARYAQTLVDGRVPAAEPNPASDGAAAPAPRDQLRALTDALVRLPLVLARLLLDLMPVLAFTAVANLLAAAPLADFDVSRLVMLAIGNAYALSRGSMCAVRALVSSSASGPGVLMTSAETATYVEGAIRRIVMVAVFGIAAADTALLLGLDVAVYRALVSIVALAGHVLLAIIILQCRRPIAALIRGPIDREGTFAQLRLWAANVWHLVAIFVDFGLWMVWILKLPNGYGLLLRLCLVSAAVVMVARLIAAATLASLDRLLGAGTHGGPSGLRARAVRYRVAFRRVVYAAISAIAAVFLLQAWGIDTSAWFARGSIGGRLLWALVTIGIATAVAAFVWEASNLAIERYLERLTQGGQYARVVRLRTLLPVLRAVLLTIILVVVGLTALAELGINITPLLASAGIAGIAVGIGSQKLVQDVITGLFLMIENSMQVGEWVTAGGVSGSVERLTVRTVQLRGADGALHIVPYSAVSTVSNTSRGTGNAAVSVNIARGEDIDRVGEVLKEIASGMRQEPRFAALMRGDLDLWGVDKVEGSGVTVAGQIVCTDTGRWPVQREFNRRMKIRFEEVGIQLAIPAQRIELRTQPSDPANATPKRPSAEA